MLVEPVIDLFKELLSPLVEIASKLVDSVRMDAVVHREALESTLSGVTGYVVAQGIGVVEQVGAEKSNAACIHFDRHVIATPGNVATPFVFFNRPCF